MNKVSFREKISSSMKVSMVQITIAGLLIGLGVISDTYIRLGHHTFLTTSIYIVIGLILPLWLGIASAFLIDFLQLLFRGMLGYWYWSLQLEPAMIVFISFSFKFLFTSIRNKTLMQWIAIVFMIAIISGSAVIFAMYSNEFSFNKIMVKGNLETSSEQTTRIVQRYISLLGILIVISMLIYEIYKFSVHKTYDSRIASMIIVIATSIVIDWLFHPWAVYNWRVHSLGMAPSTEIFRVGVISGIWNSAFHIAIGIPIVASSYYVYKNTLVSKENKY